MRRDGVRLIIILYVVRVFFYVNIFLEGSYLGSFCRVETKKKNGTFKRTSESRAIEEKRENKEQKYSLTTCKRSY